MEPIAFPTAVLGLLFHEAIADTTISGAEDPIATIVSPITIDDTPRFVAKADAPYTNLSALQLRATRPARNIITSMITRLIQLNLMI
ncbi:hypothetical protein GCM10009114_36560 [Aliiglaciecola litoralis]|uniref:Uncharacterized protein n=1 Tax=Aliiglaciecola litoralis TaxID=582857 RepID=A0ABP3X6L0_9ALTE